MPRTFRRHFQMDWEDFDVPTLRGMKSTTSHGSASLFARRPLLRDNSIPFISRFASQITRTAARYVKVLRTFLSLGPFVLGRHSRL